MQTIVSLLNKNLKHKLHQQKTDANVCLDLPPCSHIGVTYFRNINWLSVSEGVESCIATIVFKNRNEIVPSYVNGRFQLSLNRYNTRSHMTLDIPLWKTNTRQHASSFLRPQIWNYGFHYTYSEEINFKENV